MRIGIDFDNTLACYDELFWELACEGGLVDASIPHRKDAVRDHLRRANLESTWTALQGQAYGPRILEADPFPGSVSAVADFRRRGWQVFIVSHKTRTPIAGPEYNLHAAARNWLLSQGILGQGIFGQGMLGPAATSLGDEQLFFELTKADKLERIRELKCDWFIDDLPEILTDSQFAPKVGRILFDPHDQFSAIHNDLFKLKNWSDAAAVINKERRP